MPGAILVVTGASGAGKTTAVRALEARRLRGVRCFHLDSIGVPPPDVMEREYGGGEGWQGAVTRTWLERLAGLPDDCEVAVLDGQTRPSFVFAAAPLAAPRSVHVVLLDCAAEVRAARLRGPRMQPDLDTPRMNEWAAYLRGQADAMELPVLDTSLQSIEESADALAVLVDAIRPAQYIPS